MAITKIHSIKSTVGKAIDYIGNFEKTASGTLIYTNHCCYGTAAIEFEITREKAREGGDNLCYHLVQSFKPGEVTAEQCHEIGKKLADRLLDDNYEYVMCTHIDKAHYHNHIIFNAVNRKTYRRYRSDKKSYRHIREVSDKICEEYGLNVIEASEKHKSKEKYQYHYSKPITQKCIIRKAIDSAILYSSTYEEFIDEMKRRCFDIRQDDYLWFKLERGKHFTKTETIGRAYSEENIRKRIYGLYRPKNITLLIDIESHIKYTQSYSYENWVKIYNLKAAAQTLIEIDERGISNYTELDSRLSAASDRIAEIKNTVSHDKNRIDEINALIKNIEIKQKNKSTYDEYIKKPKIFQSHFYKNHHKKLDAYIKADKVLKRHSVKGKYPSKQALFKEKEKLESAISAGSDEIKTAKAAYDDLSALKYNIDIFLGKEKTHEKQTVSNTQSTVSSTNKVSIHRRLKENQVKVDAYKRNRQNNRQERNHYEL